MLFNFNTLRIIVNNMKLLIEINVHFLLESEYYRFGLGIVTRARGANLRGAEMAKKCNY